MTEPDAEKLPEPFEFSLQPPSTGQRMGRLFTRKGRAQRTLWRAYSDLNSSAKQEALTHRVVRLLRGGRQRERAALNTFVRLGLLYLVWYHMRKDQLEGACKWMVDLDEEFPDLPERVSLRWELMQRLLASGDTDGYVSQAQKLLADPLVKPGVHAPAILHAVSTTYGQVSPSACEGVVGAANAQIARARQLRAALALCRCPRAFVSRREAESWTQQANPEHLGFSSVMRADALVVAARAAEWSNSADAMIRCVNEALGLVPGHLQARYWLARARFRQSGGDPAKDLQLGALPQGPEWARLLAQINLHQQSTLANAEAALDVLAGRHEEPDAMERILTLALMKRALTLGPAPEAAAVDHAARICQRLEGLVGTRPWTQLNIALKEIKLDRRYDTAIERLENEEVLRQPSAHTLLRLARILAGEPLQDDQPKDPTGLGAVEWAMRRVRHAVGGVDEPDSEAPAREGLETVRQGPLGRWLPELAEAVDVLHFALRALRGDDVQGDLLARQLSGTAVPWVTWLFVRTGLTVCDASSVGGFLERLDVGSFPAAWSVDAWRCNYGRPGSLRPELVQRVRSAVGGGLEKTSGKVKSCLRGILDFRSGRRDPDKPDLKRTAIAEAFSEIGKLYVDICQAEVDLEVDFANARRSIALGSPEGAVEMLGVLRDDCEEAGTLTKALWAPAIRYWMGVALAHTAEESAQGILEEQLGGLKDRDARTQLALIAIRKGDLDRASSVLEALPADSPAVVYARALLLDRRGDHDGALALLQADETRALLDDCPGSPYVPATKRLLAAVQERRGNLEEAEKLHRENLSTHPDDAITRARLSRLLICRDYSPAEPNAAGMTPRDAEGLDGPSPVDWCRDYALLYRVLAGAVGESVTSSRELTEKMRSAEAAAWQEALARRLLGQKRPEDACTVLSGEVQPTGPAYLVRTRLILRAWQTLTGLWRPYHPPERKAIDKKALALWKESGRPEGKDEEMRSAAQAVLVEQAIRKCVSKKALEEAAKCLEEIERLPVNDDVMLKRYWDLLKFAVETPEKPLEELTAGSFVVPHVEEPWVFWRACELWSPESHRRTAAAETLLELVDREDGPLEQTRRSVLGAVGAWLLHRNESYLQFYDGLLPQLEGLPVDPVRLWLAAGHLWFWQQDWEKITGTDLPACVAEFTHPQACLLMGLAHAQTAASLKDPREMAKNVRMAREMLSRITTTTSVREAET